LASINALTVFALNGTAASPIGAFDATPDDVSPVAVTLSPDVLELAPGVTQNVTAIFSLQKFDSSRVPAYSGYIVVNSSAQGDGGALQIPFMGVAADMSKLPLFDTTGGFPTLSPLATAPNGTIWTDDSAVFSLNKPDFPAINVAMFFPSRVLKLDVLPGDPGAPTNGTASVINGVR
jgi:hypothetical protein